MVPRIYESIIPEIHVPTNLSVHQFLTRYNPEDVAPDKVVWEEADGGRTMSHGGVRDEAAIGAACLTSALGLHPGDVVAIYAPNSINYGIAAHSVLWFGGVIAGINPMTSPYDMVHYLASCEPKVIITTPELRGRVDEALSKSKNLPFQPIIVLLDETSNALFPEFYGKKNYGRHQIPPLDLTGSDNRKHIAANMFSSGSSGKPKAVQWSHHTIIAHFVSVRASQPEQNSRLTREVLFVPFGHMFGLVAAVLNPVHCASHVVIMKQFEYLKYIEASARLRATIMRMVPPIALAIAKDPNIAKYDLTSVNVIMCAGATLQAEIVNQLQTIMGGCDILQGYGLSEAAVSALKPAKSIERSGSVGRLFPSHTLRVVDDNLNDVEVGQPGEALVKGPTVFLSYKNNPIATKEAFHDGWLRTGDVVKVDEDGYIWFLDRKKEMIKYKGNQVAPAELEDLLNSHPSVAESAVCGIFDSSQQTEVPVGYVCLNDSISESERSKVLKEIRQWVDGIVSPSKKLRGGVFYIAQIPKNPTGKVQRMLLPARLEAAAKIAAENRPSKL
ncbi:acyl-CoA synthetases/AMP-acid ligases II [Lophium mytilinum]|uniref:Acyl-CoA synthetases/AMP-acid ligases II n=1 Tax=Lophium mytilinum TaxID=390894 RepID=A0A6A6RGN1_9PEZI|nr:acyl-CoA synthetases/AMP-acid ligases II [Lophium mytilinum]